MLLMTVGAALSPCLGWKTMPQKATLSVTTVMEAGVWTPVCSAADTFHRRYFAAERKAPVEVAAAAGMRTKRTLDGAGENAAEAALLAAAELD